MLIIYLIVPPLYLYYSFSPTDHKFVTCSDDGTLRIWDFLRCYEERILRGKSNSFFSHNITDTQILLYK